MVLNSKPEGPGVWIGLKIPILTQKSGKNCTQILAKFKVVAPWREEGDEGRDEEEEDGYDNAAIPPGAHPLWVIDGQTWGVFQAMSDRFQIVGGNLQKFDVGHLTLT